MKRETERIRCEEVRPRLSEYMDHALDIETMIAVAAHLEGCPECAKEADLLMATAAAVQEAAMTPPAALYPSVMKKVRRSYYRKMLVRSGSTIAAAVLLVAALLYAKPVFNHKSMADPADHLKNGEVSLPYYTSSSSAIQSSGWTGQHSSEDFDKLPLEEIPAPEGLHELIETLKDEGVRVVYIPVRADAFDNLRTNLSETAILYMDSANIAFEYQAQKEYFTIVIEPGSSTEDSLIVVAYLND